VANRLPDSNWLVTVVGAASRRAAGKNIPSASPVRMETQPLSFLADTFGFAPLHIISRRINGFCRGPVGCKLASNAKGSLSGKSYGNRASREI
jgi:hypothetical protein